MALLGGSPLGSGQGFVFLEGHPRLVYVLNRYARTAERVLVEMAAARLDEDDVVDSLISRCDFGLLGRVTGVTLDADESVTRLRSRWMTHLSSLLPRAFGSRGGVRVQRGRSDAYLYLGVDGSSASLYADTTGDSLNFREYRVYNHPSSIRPSLAASLVFMANADGGVLYDPFCGGGTILIEAALMSLARPTHARRTYRFRSFAEYTAEEERSASLNHPVIRPFEYEVGTEINSVHLKGCRKNLSAAGLGDLRVSLGDCTKTVLERRADVIVTNPPYGVRGSKLTRMEALSSRFLQNLPNILRPGGRAVVVTSDAEMLKREMARTGLVPSEVAKTLHSHLWVEGIAFRMPEG